MRAVIDRVEHVMGMPVRAVVRDAVRHGGAVDDVFGWLRWVDATFSTYDRSSEISRWGRGELALRDAHPLVRDVLGRCARLRADDRRRVRHPLSDPPARRSARSVRAGQGLGDRARGRAPVRGGRARLLPRRRRRRARPRRAVADRHPPPAAARPARRRAGAARRRGRHVRRVRARRARRRPAHRAAAARRARRDGGRARPRHRRRLRDGGVRARRRRDRRGPRAWPATTR